MDEDEPLADRVSGFVQSLERGLAVIRAFDADHPSLTLSEVARKTALTRAAARRFLLTLVDLGYVRMEDRQFSLKPAVLSLGYAYLSSLGLPEVARPHLTELSQRLHESSSVSVLDGDEVYYVARAAAKRIMTVSINVGTRFPAYATSMGRVLLAALPSEAQNEFLGRVQLESLTPRTITDPVRLRRVLTQVNAQGFALVDQELELGLRSIAVPLHNADGDVIAAMNVSMHISRGSAGDAVREVLPALQETAAAIEHDLTGRAPIAQAEGSSSGS